MKHHPRIPSRNKVVSYGMERAASFDVEVQEIEFESE
jgi:hypothetical protein